MKILMIIPYPNIRGPIPKICSNLIIELRKLQCNVETECWGRHHEKEALINKFVGRFYDILKIKRKIRSEKYDIIMIHTAHDWATLSRDILLLSTIIRDNIKIILLFHGSRAGWLVNSSKSLFKYATYMLLKLSNAILLLSSEERDQWQQFYPNMKYYVVNNPYVPLNWRLMNLDNRRLQYPVTIPIILFVGRLIKSKGIYDLLSAMALLKDKLFHLIVVGEGSEKNNIYNYINLMKLHNYVTMVGYVNDKNIAFYYNIADIFVLPSSHDEGFPTVIMESMEFGLPILTTKLRGAIDHLVDGINVLFVEPHNPVSLAKSIAKLLSDPDLCVRMGQANKKKVKEFAPELVGRHYLKILREITESVRVDKR